MRNSGRRSGWRHKWTPSLVMLLFLSAGPFLLAGPRILPPGDPAAEPVIAVAVELTAQVAEGNRDRAYELFAGSGDDAKILEAQLRFVAASDSLHRVLEARFGERVPSLARVLLKELSERQSHEGVVLDGDAACTGFGLMTNAGTELRRIGGRWKVVHLSADPTRTPNLLAFYTSMADLMDVVRSGVDAGKLNLDAAGKQLNGSMTTLRSGAFWASRTQSAATLQPSVPPPAGTETGSQLFALLGASLASGPMTDIIDRLPPLPRVCDGEDSAFVNSYETGLSFSFRVRAPTVTLQSVHLYAEGQEGYRQFRGSLPNGLTFEMNRGEVEAKLGRPDSLGPGFASYRRRGIAIGYASHAPEDFRNPANRIAHVTLFRPDPGADPPLALPGSPKPWLTFRLESDAPDAVRFPDPNDPAGKATIRLSPEVLIDEADVIGVTIYSPEMNLQKRWQVGLDLSPAAAKRLAGVSAANIGRRLAIVLDGRVILNAVIRGRLAGHIVIDTGDGGGEKECRRLIEEIGLILYSLPTPPGGRRAFQSP